MENNSFVFSLEIMVEFLEIKSTTNKHSALTENEGNMMKSEGEFFFSFIN